MNNLKYIFTFISILSFLILAIGSEDDCAYYEQDCNGVCYGNAVVDCNGNCDGGIKYDCNDICGGTAEIDCLVSVTVLLK